MILSKDEQIIQQKYQALHEELDERSRRIWAATEANAFGHGGITAVSRATGLAVSTIRIGKSELEKETPASPLHQNERRTRKKGGGRKQSTTLDTALLHALDILVEPTARGDPMSPLRWTCKSTRHLAHELVTQGHHVSHTKVGQLLE